MEGEQQPAAHGNPQKPSGHRRGNREQRHTLTLKTRALRSERYPGVLPDPERGDQARRAPGAAPGAGGDSSSRPGLPGNELGLRAPTVPAAQPHLLELSLDLPPAGRHLFGGDHPAAGRRGRAPPLSPAANTASRPPSPPRRHLGSSGTQRARAAGPAAIQGAASA